MIWSYKIRTIAFLVQMWSHGKYKPEDISIWFVIHRHYLWNNMPSTVSSTTLTSSKEWNYSMFWTYVKQHSLCSSQGMTAGTIGTRRLPGTLALPLLSYRRRAGPPSPMQRARKCWGGGNAYPAMDSSWALPAPWWHGALLCLTLPKRVALVHDRWLM